jgi:malate/lactate dehydrogenase
VGKLGSTIAYMTLRELKPEKIILKDIRDLKGEVMDLQDAARGLNLTTNITTENDSANYIIICAGQGRNEQFTTMDKLVDFNEPIVRSICSNIKPFLLKDAKVIVMTNPVEKMTEVAKKELPEFLVTNPEKELMNMRNKNDHGYEIVKSKGYSNWGPGVSCIKLIKKMEQS